MNTTRTKAQITKIGEMAAKCLFDIDNAIELINETTHATPDLPTHDLLAVTFVLADLRKIRAKLVQEFSNDIAEFYVHVVENLL